MGLLWDSIASTPPSWTVSDSNPGKGHLPIIVFKARDFGALGFLPNRISNLGVVGRSRLGPCTCHVVGYDTNGMESAGWFEMMKTRTYFVFAGLLISLVAMAKPNPQKFDEEFYKLFRKYFLDKDFSKLASVTKFPLEIKGTLDDDPVKLIPKENFREFFALIYESDTGLRPEQFSHLDYIRMQKEFPMTGATDRIGSLVFTRIRGQYKLTQIFLDTLDDKVIAACTSKK